MRPAITKSLVLLIALVVCPVMSAQGQSLSIANPSLPDGIVVVPYHQQLFATGGSGPYTWTITAGSLPAGMHLDAASGILSGPPTLAGDYSFTVQAADQVQVVGQKALTLKIVPGFGDLVAVDRVTGYAYKVALDGNTTPIGISVGTGIPAGPEDVAVDPNTGDVYVVTSGNGVWKIAPSGTTQQFYAGPFANSAVAIAVDRNSNVYVAENQTNQVYKLDPFGNLVGNPFATLAAYTGSAQDIRMLFDRDGNLIVGADGGGPKIDSISPAGVVTHVYTGGATVPFVGIGGIAFANDGSGALVVADWVEKSLIKITNIGTPSMATSTLMNLPSLSAGIIGLAGHPTNPGEYYVLTNAAGGTSNLYRVVLGTNSVTSLVNFGFATGLAWSRFAQAPYLAISPAAVPDGTVGVNYSQHFSATAAPGSLTWTNSGTLPPGLTLDESSGVLWGTPTQAGDYRFNLVATYGGQSAHQALTLKIEPGYGDLIVSDSLGVYRVSLDGSKTRIDTTPPITWAYGVAADADGNGYAAQSGVWKFPPLGGQTQISTVGGVALAVDRYGNMYVGRNDIDVVYKLNPSGQMVDAAGNPTSSPFVVLPSSPSESEDIRMIFDRDGYLLVASDARGAQQIQRVSPSGEVTRLFTEGATPFTGAGGIAFANDGSGALVVADFDQNSLIKISNLGTPSMVASTLITSNSLCCNMVGMVADPTNSGEYLVVINDAPSGANSTLKRVVPATGSVTTVASFNYALDIAALRFSQPTTLATLTLGNLTQTYDGTPRGVSVATGPTGVPVAVTYTGTSGTVYGPSTTPPTNPGTYQVNAVAQGIYQGSATGTLTISAPQDVLVVVPDSQVITYGGAVPALTYTVAGLPAGQTLDTGATCVVPIMVGPPVGTYPISCSGAAKAPYTVLYAGGTLTVNPAPLTIIADNKSMGVGSTLPLLTASYFGFVNGDTPAVLGGKLQLTTDATSGSPAGTYRITFAQVPALSNYTVTTVPGTLTVNPDLLTFNNNYFVTGDFAVGWASLRGLGGTDGFATGEISIPNVGLSDPANTVPAGADIVAAYLYWQAVEWSGFAPEANGFFRGYSITGQQLGSDLPFSPDPAPPLVSGGVSMVTRMYRANVLPYLPLDADGRRLPAGPHSVKLPEAGGSQLPLNSGASLVVIYRVLSKDFPLKAVSLYDGAWVKPDGLQLTIRGFYDANLGQTARAFNMASTASAFMPNLLTFTPPAGTVGQYAQAFPAAEGTAGGMQIFSVAVNDSDGDGLLDAWEAGPPAGDPHAGQPGYYEVTDGSWVPLPGAVNGQKDMFVQLDYMCSTVKSDGTCDPLNSRLPQLDPVTGQNPLLMVQQAFGAIGINLHYVNGYAIQEETCSDGPNGLCQFTGGLNEPGVIGWKTGLEVLKVWPRDPTGCVAGTNPDGCKPRFPRGQKDSHHYVVFGDSLAVSAWNTRARTLSSVVVSNGVATITTPSRTPLKGSTCPTRVTISGALGAPALNGVYNVSSCNGATGITIATPGVGDWTYTQPASPADEREPMLAVISGDVSSISGYSDLGGADTAVTLFKWATDPTQDMSKKPNVQAGTLMHELGHTIGLAHGGAYADTAGSYALTFGANCKPNYQSIMNYLFQIDLLPGNVLAFSNQALDMMNENAGSANWTVSPSVAKTRWYVPWSASQGDAALRHCDGSAILDGSQMVREEGYVTPLDWTPGQDINFDGQLNTGLRGYNDLSNIDLRQVGAAGAEYVSMAGLLGFGSGGTLALGSGGTLALGSGGTLALGSGGTFTMGSGGTFTMGSGGTLTFGSDGTITFSGEATLTMGSNGSIVFGTGGGTLVLGSGGTLALGSGGTLALGSGGTFTMGSGGTLVLGGLGGTVTFGSGGGSVAFPDGGGAATFGSGGTAGLGSGGTLGLGSGGTLALGSGGTLALGSGGTFTMGSGGTFTMGSGGTYALGSGGTLTMGSGGTFTMGSGGTFTMGSGGTFTMGSGGTFTMGSGGTFTMGSGGTFALGSGGTLALGSGGTLALGSGGTLALGSGGTFALGSGGVMEEMTYETANSVVRPPSGVTQTNVGGQLRIDWQAPSFGVVSAYNIYYRVPGTATSVPVGTVSGNQTTFTVSSPVADAVYFVTTTIAAIDEVPARSSPPSNNWIILGFHSPVSMTENGSLVYNVVKAGSTVPLKFNIYVGGVEQKELSAVVTPIVFTSVGCTSGETTTLTSVANNTGDTPLRYDGTQFIQNWRTPMGARVCTRVQMTAKDGGTITAYFKTK